jgi:hypothetical protein
MLCGVSQGLLSITGHYILKEVEVMLNFISFRTNNTIGETPKKNSTI